MNDQSAPQQNCVIIRSPRRREQPLCLHGRWLLATVSQLTTLNSITQEALWPPVFAKILQASANEKNQLFFVT